jgi:hypothetical protein
MSFADLSREFLRDYHLALRNLEDSWEGKGCEFTVQESISNIFNQFC